MFIRDLPSGGQLFRERRTNSFFFFFPSLKNKLDSVFAMRGAQMVEEIRDKRSSSRVESNERLEIKRTIRLSKADRFRLLHFTGRKK